MEGTCEECRYWRQFGEPRSGECHRNAPLPYVFDPEKEKLHKTTQWPLTTAGNACGEFEPKT